MHHRENNFDFLRLVAAMMVLISHQFALSGLPEPMTPIGSWGGAGVLVFFAISGFLVAGSWVQDPHPGRFAMRRLLRIWPGLLVALVLVALVLGPFVSALPARDYYAHSMTWTYFRQLGLWSFEPMLPDVFLGNPMPLGANGSLWTIPIEVRCYMALVLVGVLGLFKRQWLLPAAFVLFAYWFFFLFKIGYDRPIRMLMQMTVVFFAGACMYQLRTIWRPRLAIAWLVTILAVGGLWWSGVQEIAATLGLPVLVVLAGTAATPVLRRAGRFGDISYGLYIYAFPVQQTWVWLGGRGMSFAVGVLCCTAITVVLAWLSWRLVEQPALKLKPRGARPRPGPVA